MRSEYLKKRVAAAFEATYYGTVVTRFQKNETDISQLDDTSPVPEVISFPEHDTWPENHIRADSVAELRTATALTNLFFEHYKMPRDPQWRIDAGIAHESEHGSVLEKLGKTPLYSLELSLRRSVFGHRIVVDSYLTHAYNYSEPFLKIELAAIASHPGAYLERDIAELYNMGYHGGVQEVGQKIEHYNLSSPRTPLPLPKTYRHPKMQNNPF